MRTDKSKEAYDLGTRMFRTDEWLKQALRGAEDAAENGGKEALLLVVRELGKDDHFQMNWWPVLLKMAEGDEDYAHELLSHVWAGFVDAFMDTHFNQRDATLETIESLTNRKRK